MGQIGQEYGSEPVFKEISCLVGRLGSGVRVSASFHKNWPPRESVKFLDWIVF